MNKEKIAIIGSGISGISASLLLSKKYDVYLFEKNNYLGGHTRTKTIKENNLSLSTIINKMLKYINKNKKKDFSVEKYLKILERLGEIEYNMSSDFNYNIQFYSFISIFRL